MNKAMALGLFLFSFPQLSVAGDLPYFQFGEGYAVNSRSDSRGMNSAGVNFAVGYRISRRLSLQGDYAGYPGGDHSLGMGSIRVAILNNKKIRPYLIGGFGIVDHQWLGLGFGSKAGVGVLFPVNRALSLGLESSFVKGFGK
jgi:hypothetical protein